MAKKVFRVLHLSPFHQSISGSDESLVDLIGKLGAFGIESIVALPKSSPYICRYEKAGAKIVHLPVVSIRRSYRPDYWAAFAFGMAADLLGFKSLLKSDAIQLVHTNMETAPTGLLAAHRARLPSVVHVRSTSIGRPRSIFLGLVRFLKSHADRAVAISDAVFKLLLDGGFPRERLVKIYDPVDVDLYRPRSKEEIPMLFSEKLGDLKVSAGSRFIALVGRMNPIKGQDVFLEAAARMSKRFPDVVFLLIGSAADKKELLYEEHLRKKAISLGIAERTHFLGYRPDIHEILPLCAASVSPSSMEAFGRPAAEAMSCGVPAIVAATDGLMEIVKDGETGWIVPPRDPEVLSQAICKVLSDSDRAAEMGRRGRERVIANFSSAIHAEKMRSLFESLI